MYTLLRMQHLTLHNYLTKLSNYSNDLQTHK